MRISTGVQTCALPIPGAGAMAVENILLRAFGQEAEITETVDLRMIAKEGTDLLGIFARTRWEERRVGKECVCTCRSRWSRIHSKHTCIYNSSQITHIHLHIVFIKSYIYSLSSI